MTDSADRGEARRKRPLGPHRPPRITCEGCGEDHHYDVAKNEYGAHCPNCGSFLRQPTQEEDYKMGLFMDWNLRHSEGIGR